MTVRLGVNVDHVATLRNARGGAHPDPFDAAVAAFGRLMRLATLVTPNLPELAALGGEAAVRATGAALLVKGGHGEGEEIVDRLVTGDGREGLVAGAERV